VPLEFVNTPHVYVICKYTIDMYYCYFYI